MSAVLHCFTFPRHCVAFARSRALFSAGNNIEARIAIIAITTRSSIKVKPPLFRRFAVFIIRIPFILNSLTV